jgi:glycosyltransferase involved in cell wall biosynthesis
MKIALIHYSLPPVTGGVERVLADHARLFTRHGHEVSAISGTPNANLGPGITTITLPELSQPSLVPPLATDPDHPWTAGHEQRADTLAEHFVSLLHGFDLAIVHNMLTMPFHLHATIALGRAANLLPIRWVNWIHDVAASNPDYFVPTDGPWTCLRTANPAFEHVAVSELRCREFSEVTGIPAPHVEIIPNGIDCEAHFGLTDELQHLSSKYRWLERDAILFHPARILRRKNIEAGLHTIAALRNEGIDAGLLITGAPDPHHSPSAAYAEELATLRKQLKLEDHVWFLGEHIHVSAEALQAAYALADILWFPSHREGFGLPLLEAAVRRLPILASPLEPLREQAIPGAQWLPDPFSAAEAVRKIRKMLENEAIQARKSVFRQSHWDHIYRRHIEPLLARPGKH